MEIGENKVDVEVADLWEVGTAFFSVKCLVLEIVEDRSGPIACVQWLGPNGMVDFCRFNKTRLDYILVARL